tara:strand:+ start:1847 stop:2893 length:1047 start_codon:yes stop_codon:yes gene_type:complete
MKSAEYSVFNAANYYSIFECSEAEREDILNYQLFLITDGQYDKILKHRKYSPSDIWKQWLSDTYVCFSSSHMMIKSGHRLLNSYNPFFFTTYSAKPQPGRLKQLIYACRKLFSGHDIDAKAHGKLYSEIYSQSYLPADDIHRNCIALNPGAYYRALEVNSLKRHIMPQLILEVGAGACMNIAHNYSQSKSKAIIVDLPETIYVGYSVLRTLFPNASIVLPDQINTAIKTNKSILSLLKSSDFIFMLPTQVDFIEPGIIDSAFNIASFQEMEQEVVNNYLAMIHKSLKVGGSLTMMNLSTSRQIGGNAMSEYNLELFSDGSTFEPKYSNKIIKKLKGLSYVVFDGIKKN